MITFYDVRADAIFSATINSRTVPIFNPSSSDFLSKATAALSHCSGCKTPYQPALRAAEEAIKYDRAICPTHKSTYFLFFLTDGAPTDRDYCVNQSDAYCKYSVSKYGAAFNIHKYVNVNPIYVDIERLLDTSIVKTRNVYLSSAYYGHHVPTLETFVEEMANRGKGRYVNFRNQPTLDFNSLLVAPAVESWSLRDQLLMVHNATATICEDGKVGADSDVDFLCDRDELRYGLDPTNRFSVPIAYKDYADLWYGYGDYFRLQAIKFNGSLIPCTDRTDEDRDLLTYCEETYYIANDNPLGTVEKEGHPEQSDMDRDGFLDGIELSMFRQGGFALDSSNTHRSFDGEREDAGTQVRQHRNPLVEDSQAHRFHFNLEPDHFTEEGEECFSYTQSNLQVHNTMAVKKGRTLEGLEHAAGENVILSYYTQTLRSEPGKQGVLHYNVQKVNKENPLRLKPESFDTYESVESKFEGLMDVDYPCPGTTP